MSEYLEFAKKAAKGAGKMFLEVFNREFEISYKTGGGYKSPVTEADTLSEKHIVEAIKKTYPTHGIVSEEAGKIPGESEFVWLVDPLDGTRNFSHKIPRFSVSIALVQNGKVICGAVYDPVLDELFFAEKGGGAFLNGKRISVSNVKEMEDALVSLDGAMSPEVKKAVPRTMEKILPLAETVRVFAGAALDLCWSAARRLDGIVNHRCSAWDVAAGGLILTEAGGIIEDAFGEEKFPYMTRYVAGTPLIARQLMSIMNA